MAHETVRRFHDDETWRRDDLQNGLKGRIDLKDCGAVHS